MSCPTCTAVLEAVNRLREFTQLAERAEHIADAIDMGFPPRLDASFWRDCAKTLRAGARVADAAVAVYAAAGGSSEEPAP